MTGIDPKPYGEGLREHVVTRAAGTLVENSMQSRQPGKTMAERIAETEAAAEEFPLFPDMTAEELSAHVQAENAG